MLKADRGYIYTWSNKEYSNLVLVVSSDRRANDNLISILFLSVDKGENERDIVQFRFNNTNWIVRTDLVTYTNRNYLTTRIGSIQEDVMKEIDGKIAEGLGVNNNSLVSYETMYDNLITKILQTLKKKRDDDGNIFSN